MADSLYSRVDILVPKGKSAWDIVEVKSSTAVKDINIHDVAFQKYCCEKFGLEIKGCYLAYVNNQYVKQGEIQADQFLNLEDIGREVNVCSSGIEKRVNDMLSIIAKSSCPEVLIGKHCSDPYECSLMDLCWDHVPEGSVFELYYGGKKSYKLFESGIMSIKDIPEDFNLSDKQQIQWACEIGGKPHCDKEALKEFLDSLEYPVYYLDFETINPCVPLFDGMRPYQRVPFQYSLHVVKKQGAAPEYYSFLAKGEGDPRIYFLESLQSVLGEQGSIVVYSQSFEEGVLKELSTNFPEYQDWIRQVCARFRDLLVPFRLFSYYDPQQRGSASLKKVLPALTGVNYSALAINEGGQASLAYLDTICGKIHGSEREKVYKDLEEYCCLDTEGMIAIVDKLHEIIN